MLEMSGLPLQDEEAKSIVLEYLNQNVQSMMASVFSNFENISGQSVNRNHSLFGKYAAYYFPFGVSTEDAARHFIGMYEAILSDRVYEPSREMEYVMAALYQERMDLLAFHTRQAFGGRKPAALSPMNVEDRVYISHVLEQEYSRRKNQTYPWEEDLIMLEDPLSFHEIYLRSDRFLELEMLPQIIDFRTHKTFFPERKIPDLEERDMIRQVLVRDYAFSNASCAYAVIRTLSELFSIQPSQDLLLSAMAMDNAMGEKGLEGIITGIRLFVGLYLGKNGPAEMADRFAQAAEDSRTDFYALFDPLERNTVSRLYRSGFQPNAKVPAILLSDAIRFGADFIRSIVLDEQM